MLSDRASPPGFPLFRPISPFDQVLQNFVEVARNFAPVPLSQAFDLLGDILPIDTGRPRPTQARGLICRPCVKVLAIAGGRSGDDLWLVHWCESKTGNTAAPWAKP